MDCPVAKSSCKPTLVNIRSTKPIVASAAGTKHPIWAINVISAACLMNVDFPAMFGPVTTHILTSSLDNRRSLGTKDPKGFALSTIGCRPSLISMTPSKFKLGLTYAWPTETSAQAVKTSICATIRPRLLITELSSII